MKVKSLTLFLLSGCAITIVALYNYYLPYGQRDCYMPCILSSLQAYAYDHNGWFPKEGKTPLESLQLLYPRYIGPDANLLSGISGDRKTVNEIIQQGGHITAEYSSWIYFSGLRSDDDPAIALIYERQPGVQFNGIKSKGGGHVVGFVDGNFKQIPDGKWETFLEEQSSLRNNLRRNSSSTPQP
jgi:hypothetical protein